ncbi:MAG: methyltransferase domain-containing protein [Candidatus Electrothrix sp. AW1]|nr:methyltransferase domain-containing protein [Candidatus Electrothrix sp. AX1]MCI5182597.1 methyltransferase domain-containing protein [Candidatus Electrothrix gigas]
MANPKQKNTVTFMKCPLCKETSTVKLLFKAFTNVEYGHAYCIRCGVSFDTNVNEMINVFSKVDASKVINLQEDEYRKYFIETSDITDGSTNIYTSFNWNSQDELKTGVVQPVIKEINKQYQNLDQFSVLDIGCGDGFTTDLLSNYYPKANFLAVDPSPQIKKLNGNRKIRACQGVIQHIDFSLEKFDVIIIIGNLMLHTDPLDTLERAKELLTDTGILIFDFKNINSASRIIARKITMAGIYSLNNHSYLQRNFLNMRYGLSKEFMLNFCNKTNLTVQKVYSKPPRLLAYGNQSKYTAGVFNVVWRILNFIDSIRDEMAWVQFTCKRKNF